MVAKAKGKGKTASDTLDLKKCHCTLQLSHQCKHTNTQTDTRTHTHTFTQRECCGQQPFWPASLAKRKGHLSTETRDNRKRADTHPEHLQRKRRKREEQRKREREWDVERLHCKLTPLVLCACTASLPLSPHSPWGVSSFDTFNGLRLTGGTCGTGRVEAPGTASVVTALRPAALQLM